LKENFCMDLFSLAGRVALVSGAGRGIGKALAIGLADAGADVVCLSRTSAEIEQTAALVRERGRRSMAITVDTADRELVERAVKSVMAEWGRIDVLVNNAGTNVRTPALEVKDQDWDTVLNTNLKGCFLMSQACGRVMCAAGYGRIINIASVAGVVSVRSGVAYASSKGGLFQMTRSLAVEWAKYGVLVNAIGPWYFRTPLADEVLKNEAYFDAVIERTPLRRVGNVEELIGPVVFLASAASSYVTGQALMVDGGVTAFCF